MPAKVCPHCGFDLVHDEVIERDGFSLDPRGVVTFEGRKVPLQATPSTVLHAIAKGEGRPVSTQVLHERLGYDGDGNLADVYLTRIRNACREVSAPVPFHNVRGRGFAWGA